MILPDNLQDFLKNFAETDDARRLVKVLDHAIDNVYDVRFPPLKGQPEEVREATAEILKELRDALFVAGQPKGQGLNTKEYE